MSTENEALMAWLESFPTTDKTLNALGEMDLPKVEKDPAFVADLLKGMVTEDILRAMDEQHVNRNQLAQLLGKSRQYVGRVLNENANFSLERLAEFACALDRSITVRVHRKNEKVTVQEMDDYGLSNKTFQECDSSRFKKQVAVPVAPLDTFSDLNEFDRLETPCYPNVEASDEEYANAA